MASFTLVIPCFNEEKNIESLVKEIRKLESLVNLEIILVDNGSTDNTKNELIKIEKQKILKNLKLIFVEKNIGFGFGVKKGVIASSSNLVCYTHADLQTDILDVHKAYKIFKDRESENCLVKGKRINRSISESIFSISMSIINSIIFRYKIFDIHAQPNFFKKNMITDLNYFPNDFGIDIYLLLVAKRKKYNVVRFEVLFKKRKYGVGNNEGIINKIKHSYKSIISAIQILTYGKF